MLRFAEGSVVKGWRRGYSVGLGAPSDRSNSVFLWAMSLKSIMVKTMSFKVHILKNMTV